MIFEGAMEELAPTEFVMVCKRMTIKKTKLLQPAESIFIFPFFVLDVQLSLC